MMEQIENNNYVEERLNGSHKIKITYDSGKFFLEIMNGKEYAIMKKESNKDILQVISIKKDIIRFIIDNNIIADPKEARSYINKVYAKLTPQFLKIKEDIEKAKKTTNRMNGEPDEENQYVFDTDDTRKRLHSGIGIMPLKIEYGGKTEDVRRFYFGFNIEKKVPQYTESGSYLRDARMQKLCLIFDDHSMVEAEDLEVDHNIEFTGDLIQDNYRWKLEAMKKYLDARGTPEESYNVISLKKVFDMLKEKYQQYNYFHDDRYYDLFPVWDIGTYFFPLFDAYPYISLESNLPGSGKTKTMTLSSIVTFNALMVVNITPSSLFRIVDSSKSTLYVDEAEDLYKKVGKKGEDDASDVVSLLNAGWQKGAKVPRQEKTESGKWKTVFFDSYSPKMISSLNGVKGPLESRSIHCPMLRTLPNDPRGDLWPDDNDLDLRMIRNYMYPMALKNWVHINLSYRSSDDKSAPVLRRVVKEFKINNRDWQIWKPLLVIAKQIDDDLYRRLGEFAEEMCQSSVVDSVDEDSWDYRLAESLVDITTDKEEWVSVKQIKGNLDTKFGEADKKPSSHWIGRKFKRMGLKKRCLNSGKEYLLSRKIVCDVLQRSNLMSLTSQTSQTSLKTEIEEEQIIDEIEPTNLKCANCGQTSHPCTYLDKKTGKPICKTCYEVYNQE